MTWATIDGGELGHLSSFYPLRYSMNAIMWSDGLTLCFMNDFSCGESPNHHTKLLHYYHILIKLLFVKPELFIYD